MKRFALPAVALILSIAALVFAAKVGRDGVRIEDERQKQVAAMIAEQAASTRMLRDLIQAQDRRISAIEGAGKKLEADLASCRSVTDGHVQSISRLEKELVTTSAKGEKTSRDLIRLVSQIEQAFEIVGTKLNSLDGELKTKEEKKPGPPIDPTSQTASPTAGQP